MEMGIFQIVFIINTMTGVTRDSFMAFSPGASLDLHDDNMSRTIFCITGGFPSQRTSHAELVIYAMSL